MYDHSCRQNAHIWWKIEETIVDENILQFLSLKFNCVVCVVEKFKGNDDLSLYGLKVDYWCMNKILNNKKLRSKHWELLLILILTISKNEVEDKENKC